MFNLTTNPTIDQYEVTADDALLLVISYWFFRVLINDSNEEADKETFTFDDFEMDEPKEVDKAELASVDIT